jgi:hypothetical protein
MCRHPLPILSINPHLPIILTLSTYLCRSRPRLRSRYHCLQATPSQEKPVSWLLPAAQFWASLAGGDFTHLPLSVFCSCYLCISQQTSPPCWHTRQSSKYWHAILPWPLSPPIAQAINLRKGNLSAGYSLLLKSGPHWLELCPSALPLTIYASSSGSSTEAVAGRGETNEAPPVQVWTINATTLLFFLRLPLLFYVSSVTLVEVPAFHS